MKILNSLNKKNNKFNRRSIRLIKIKGSKRLIKNNRVWLKNGGGKKEELIQQIGDIINRIYSIELAVDYDSQWCNAPGPNPECDALEKQKKTLIEQYKSEFPEKDLTDALALRRRQREYEEDASRRQQQYQEAQERLDGEYTTTLNAYKTKIARIPKDDSSLEEERANLEIDRKSVV